MKELTIIDQLSLAEFTFHDNKEEGSIMNDFEGWEYPSSRIVMQDLPARDGALAISARFGRRLCSFVSIHTCEVLERRREVLLALNQNSVLKMIKFTTIDDIDLQFEAYINKVVGPYTAMMKPFMIEFIAPDFRFYSQTEYNFNTGVTTSPGGMAIPAPIPAPIGGGSSNTLLLVNSGDFNTNPIIYITGPGTNFVVQNLDTGERFELNITLASLEVVTIDTLNRTVMKGNQNIFGFFSGDWMTLRAGSNRIAFNGQTGITTNTNIRFTYRDAYIGV